jgi:hypothetical protein
MNKTYVWVSLPDLINRLDYKIGNQTPPSFTHSLGVEYYHFSYHGLGIIKNYTI